MDEGSSSQLIDDAFPTSQEEFSKGADATAHFFSMLLINFSKGADATARFLIKHNFHLAALELHQVRIVN